MLWIVFVIMVDDMGDYVIYVNYLWEDMYALKCFIFGYYIMIRRQVINSFVPY